MKMRNLLEEFRGKHGIRPPTILGVREHVFTGRYPYYDYSQLFTSFWFCFYFCVNLLYFIPAAVFLRLHHLCLTRKQVLLLWGNVFLLTSSESNLASCRE